jgi:hypothetical protein
MAIGHLLGDTTLMRALLSLLALLAFGCGDQVSVCESESPPGFCDDPCEVSTDCPAGSFCAGDGSCDAECFYMGREQGCERGLICGEGGTCVPHE